MVPHILDTIIFVREGSIKKVYELTLTVKVPSGMTEADLARPLVEVRDFESGVIEYEIYTFGDENVVVPVSKLAKGGQIESGVHKLAQSKIMDVV
jgi:ATPase